MKWTLLAAVAAALFGERGLPPRALLVAAADDATCPGPDGAGPDGACPAPGADRGGKPSPRRADDGWSSDDGSSDDASSDDGSSDDDGDDDDESSDDYDVGGHPGNPHANPHGHVAEDFDPEDARATCDEYINMVGFRHDRETQSFYQELGWSRRHPGDGGPQRYTDPTSPDVCMTLDDIVQICSSYRPHYHEPFVHFPAAYLSQFRRVAFIGGGDAMLLHEALKYPGVELVLGLELDQKNVRESLAHFGTRPGFDDPRVQWWFGDAAVSLTLLPRAWFGTFDLVLVDLSETGMSISVNDDLDIFGALALLLRPGGIMVKNEDYFSQMSKYFDYSLSVYMDGNPMLCDQDWAMGTNKADFLHPKLEQGLLEQNQVHTLEYLPLVDEDEHYRMILDYAHNDARKQGLCDDHDAAKASTGETEKEVKKPTKSSGILLVADVDHVTKELDLDGFKAALGALGMTPLGDACLSRPSSDEDRAVSSLFIGMEEGHISAHTYPGKAPSSMGLEILLWSKLGKQDDILQSLLSVLGVVEESSYSSYRVIHGGVNGHQHWKEELAAIGPSTKNNTNARQCDEAETGKEVDPKASEGGQVSQELFDMVVLESMLLLLPKKQNTVVAVLCGVKGVHDCATLGSLERHPGVHEVVAIWSCPDDGPPADADADGEEEPDASLSHVFACGADRVFRSAKAAEGYSALVVDPAAPAAFLEAGEGIFCSDRILRARRHALLRERAAFVGSLAGAAGQRLFARCLRRLSKSQARGGTVVADGTAEIGVAASGDDGFVRRLVAVAESVQEKSGMRTEIVRIKSAPVPYQDDFRPVYHQQSAYDQADATKQYSNQRPLASQSIYQLEVTSEDEIKQLTPSVAKEILDVVLGEFEGFASSDRAYFEVGDGSVAIAVSSVGHVFVTWNGFGVFCVNILTEGEKYKILHMKKKSEAHLILVDHKAIVDAFQGKLPASTVVAGREQMPRGANHVVNFKYDMGVTPL